MSERATPVVRFTEPNGDPTAPLSDRDTMILAAARAIFSRCTSWTQFHAEVLGVRGLVRQHVQDLEELQAFEQSEVHEELQDMLLRLRIAAREQEPLRVITVRIPQSLHDAIRNEAKDREISVNKLCICKLVQQLDEEAFNQWRESQPEPQSRITLQRLRQPR